MGLLDKLLGRTKPAGGDPHQEMGGSAPEPASEPEPMAQEEHESAAEHHDSADSDTTPPA
jgi:hypothetical protein